MNLNINKKEQLIIGIGIILFTKIFDWSNYFLLIGIVFIILFFSDNKNEESEKPNDNQKY
jgi:hypothetical protein